jgi:glycerol-3-phosphate dehydrogenase (NAD(P)+)
MASNTTSDYPVGVVGAGSFGFAVANLLAKNKDVILFARRPEVVEALTATRQWEGRDLHPRVVATNDLEFLANRCQLLIPVIPSENFRELMRRLSPFLCPDHLMIHATKGFDIQLKEGETLSNLGALERERVKTMSEVIMEESVVRRIGCMAGPNLAAEIADEQPAATVVASRFEEVVRAGQVALRSSMFRVHGNKDLLGIELAGVLKNIMAIAAGILHGMGYGDNTLALLITRGLAEMATIGKALGADPKAFLGLAGIGDLVATCSSPRSRNYTVGYRLGKGEQLSDIVASMDEVAEGIKTVSLVRALAAYYKFPCPITQALYKTLYEDLSLDRGLLLLMEYPFREDVEFL